MCEIYLMQINIIWKQVIYLSLEISIVVVVVGLSKLNVIMAKKKKKTGIILPAFNI